ncbi:DNA adenine methylase [bacterium]|nr:DNA adenine methylase [bacterium]MBU1993170.1 DNA adenine methylase [bacterium]
MQKNSKKIVKSPLRYPGSKQKFTHAFIQILNKNEVKPELFIEPFAGGASLSLFLLQNDFVDKIALIERDPLLASFWKTVFFDSAWLIREVKKIDVNIEKWNFYKNYKPRTTRTKALKCLFLNRTNFSGILKAGPIGGQQQKSEYKIDCRFNKKQLTYQIEILSTYKERISFIEEGNYLDVLKKELVNFNDKTFIYFDPPYVNKAQGLYNFYFNDTNHIELRDFIKSLKYNWLLSYDYAPSIEDLYSDTSIFNKGLFDITYTSTSHSNRPRKKEFLASNLHHLP